MEKLAKKGEGQNAHPMAAADVERVIVPLQILAELKHARDELWRFVKDNKLSPKELLQIMIIMEPMSTIAHRDWPDAEEAGKPEVPAGEEEPCQKLYTQIEVNDLKNQLRAAFYARSIDRLEFNYQSVCEVIEKVFNEQREY